MYPSRALWEAMQELLAADVATLAEIGGLKVALVTDGLLPGLDQEFGDLVFATFAGSMNKTSGAGAQQTFYDPVTSTRVIQVLEPAGGWTWEATATPTEPETVIGYAVLDNAGAVLLGAELLPEPVTISLIGQAVTIPHIRLRFREDSPY